MVNKKAQGLVWSELGKWILIIAGAALIFIFIKSLATGKLQSTLQNLFSALRFGG